MDDFVAFCVNNVAKKRYDQSDHGLWVGLRFCIVFYLHFATYPLTPRESLHADRFKAD